MFGVNSTLSGTDHESGLSSALGWIENLLLGEVGTTLAVLAIAGIGFAMLQGRLSPRHGIRVVLACFILFGAPVIALGLARLVQPDAAPPQGAGIPQPAEIYSAPPPVPSPPPPNPDPYAGASVPM